MIHCSAKELLAEFVRSESIVAIGQSESHLSLCVGSAIVICIRRAIEGVDHSLQSVDPFRVR